MNSSMTIERTQAIARKHTRSKSKFLTFIISMMCMVCMTIVQVYAAAGDNKGGNAPATDSNIDGTMGKVLGYVFVITKWIGVALILYGIYEIVMSFMQNQPEAKTKGIIMAVSGAVMIGIKPIVEAATGVSFST